MSGHSKWSTIKHKKAANDAKRGKLFSKLVKEIVVSAKLGGGDASSNVRLRAAVDKAKSQSMPSKNIENAIKKGTGDKEGVQYEEVVYEAYAPEGVGLLIHCLTDNKNRTVSDVRSTLSKNGGRLGEAGSVSWQFEKKGVIYIEKKTIPEEQLMEVALEAGSEDITSSQEGYMVTTEPSEFNAVMDFFKEKGVAVANAEITMHPKNSVAVSKDVGETIVRLIELLDDLDDVQSISSNESFEG